MKVKEEYKGQTITINDGILGMIKIDLNTIKPMQERRLIALGYTHLFEDEKVESHEPEFKPTSQEVIDAITEIIEAPVKKTRRKKSI
jgi:hypothetical protein